MKLLKKLINYVFKMVGPETKALLRQYAVVIVVNLSCIPVGLGLAWPSPVLVKLRNETETTLSHSITEDEGSWIVSIGFLAGLLVNFLPAYTVDLIGRKYTVLLTCATKLLSSLIFTFATEVWMLYVGRGINGVFDLMTFTVVPMYASEIASKEIRGSLGTILQISSSFGILMMLSMGPFVSYLTLNIVSACVTFFTTIPIFFLPDSPYFLYSKGKTEESLKVLLYLRGSEEQAREELKAYSLSTNNQKISKRQLLTDKIFLKTVTIGIILGIGNQVVGFNAISFYLQTILESTNTSIRPEIASVIIGCIQLVASFCTAAVTDRFGRKPILTTTLVAMSLGMLGLGTFFKLRESGDELSGVMNFVPLLSLILVVIGFSAGLGSLFWILIAEIFDGPARAVGVASSFMVQLVFMFLTTKYFSSLTVSLGPATTYWLFGVNCVLLCLFILFCVPETKGKTFGEIQEAFGVKRDDAGLELEKSRF